MSKLCCNLSLECIVRVPQSSRRTRVQVDQRFPTLCRHLTRHGVNVSNMALQWFLCIFVNSLPLESCFRVWDLFFFDRCASVLFRCGLALVDTYSQVRIQGLGFSLYHCDMH